MLKFSLRELLWLTLAFAALVAWRLEATQAGHWRDQAEHAMSMLDAQTLEQMSLGDADPRVAPSYSPPLREVVSGERLPLGAAVLNAAFAWLP